MGHSAKFFFAECFRSEHSAKIFLPSVVDLALGKGFFIFFLLFFSEKRFYISLPSVVDLALDKGFYFYFFLLLLFQKKDFISLPSVFFDTRQTTSLPSVFFTECFYRSTRQRTYSPSVRENTLGKHKNTRQI